MAAGPRSKVSAQRSDKRIEETLTFRLLVAVNRIVQPFQENFGKPHDLSLPEWRCMMALAAHPGSSGEEVARHMAMDKMAVSRSLRRLEKKRRVDRQADPTNARRNSWEMTDDGWALFDLILPAALERDRHAFEDIPAKEKDRLMSILRDFEV